ncbi:TlpA disulfide reductase family protein [Geobacter benzoatilyticus]|uniref:TlpA family protein disulfide reductase n=1 Tax=Geobacter benzoatilyticus TaxID=2815309 RepID=A0ABX7Q2K7_9BACT|nr:TlpA disulfide reductase family protein [Geobacter benzoatilyticus]QSV45652.1 TlpA family protein disulfide reductase [Geobacter benzoatilyticus]
MKRTLLILLLFALMSLAGCTKEAKPPVEGGPAVDLTLNALNGEKVTLSELKGKVVILNFWATWCPPCRQEIPSMMRLNTAMAGKPFRMLCVSIDDGGKEAVEKFFSTTGFNLPAFLDTDKRAGALYGITGVPETFIIDANGVILKKIVGAIEWDNPQVIAFLNDAVAKAK